MTKPNSFMEGPMSFLRFAPLIILPIAVVIIRTCEHREYEGHNAMQLNVIVERVTAEKEKGVYGATIWFDHGKSFDMGCGGAEDGVVTGDSVVKKSGSTTFYVYRKQQLVGKFRSGWNEGRKLYSPENRNQDEK